MNELELTTNSKALSTLTEGLSALTEQLQPASDDAIAALLLKLHRAGLSYPPSIDANAVRKIYGFALKNMPIEALKRTAAKLIDGSVDGINRDFIPTPPSFAAIVRTEAAKIYADRERLSLTIEGLNRETRDPPSDEAKARVRAMVAHVKQSAKLAREPITGRAYSADELNSMYRNRIAPEVSPPGPGAYFRALQQQEEEENGKAYFGDQDQDFDRVSGGSEGQRDDRGGD